MRNLRWTLPLACCKVGLDRPLIPAAFVANLFRSARVSRPRRLTDRRSPGHAPTVGDWETSACRGRAGQEALAEPAKGGEVRVLVRRRSPDFVRRGSPDPAVRPTVVAIDEWRGCLDRRYKRRCLGFAAAFIGGHPP